MAFVGKDMRKSPAETAANAANAPSRPRFAKRQRDIFEREGEKSIVFEMTNSYGTATARLKTALSNGTSKQLESERDGRSRSRTPYMNGDNLNLVSGKRIRMGGSSGMRRMIRKSSRMDSVIGSTIFAALYARLLRLLKESHCKPR
jgi:hypothetical protein